MKQMHLVHTGCGSYMHLSLLALASCSSVIGLLLPLCFVLRVWSTAPRTLAGQEAAAALAAFLTGESASSWSPAGSCMKQCLANGRSWIDICRNELPEGRRLKAWQMGRTARCCVGIVR